MNIHCDYFLNLLLLIYFDSGANQHNYTHILVVCCATSRKVVHSTTLECIVTSCNLTLNQNCCGYSATLYPKSN